MRALTLYCLSKLCNVLFAMKLHRDFSGKGVDVYVLHPGTMISTSKLLFFFNLLKFQRLLFVDVYHNSPYKVHENESNFRYRQQYRNMGQRPKGAGIPFQQDAQSGSIDYGVLRSASGD